MPFDTLKILKIDKIKTIIRVYHCLVGLIHCSLLLSNVLPKYDELDGHWISRVCVISHATGNQHPSGQRSHTCYSYCANQNDECGNYILIFH